MTTFMIVDDEPLALESFAELLDWKSYGYQLIGCAANGKSALEMIEKKTPDIVFTDIRMPLMDGLELCGKIQEKYPHIKIVILTAYRDFEYAQKAVTYGVMEYLLKNQIEPEVVLPLLEKLKKEVEKQKHQQGVRQEHYYQSLMLDMVSENELPVPMSGEKCCCVLVQSRESYVSELLGCQPQEELHLSKEELENLLPEDGSLILQQLIWLAPKSRGLLLTTKETLDFRKNPGLLSGFFYSLQEYMQKTCLAQPFLLFEECALRPEAIKKVFRDMEKFSRYKVFMKKMNLLPYNYQAAGYEDGEVNRRELRKKTEAVMEAVSAGKREKVEEEMKLIWSEITVPQNHLGKFQYFCRYSLEMLDLLRAQNGLPSLREYAKEKQEMLGQLLWAEDIMEWITEEYALMADMKNMTKSEIGNHRIRQALDYIRENYSQKLTAKQVGEQVGFSEVYFSNLFKKEMGITFGDYLTAYRMRVAKYLLENGEYKIYEIAERTGYASPQYFSQLFLKETGMTPMEYKAGLGKERREK